MMQAHALYADGGAYGLQALEGHGVAAGEDVWPPRAVHLEWLLCHKIKRPCPAFLSEGGCAGGLAGVVWGLLWGSICCCASAARHLPAAV